MNRNAEHRPANRLAREKSPYLLQHQSNPVDWHAWGEEAFARARAEDKPIFLSIGYSTCHWCHVMERESFEDDALAAFLNAHFVSIKVDREERPDVDRIYMAFVQNATGQGGWPLTVFLTPQLEPFFGGTYFPPEPRHGRASFRAVLEELVRLWKTRRADLDAAAADIGRQLAQVAAREPAPADDLNPAILDDAAARLKADYDPTHGGFGRAPKFPHPSQPAFLLRHGARRGDAEAVRMVLHTCERMAAGGLYDHLGGGFARYSVDAQWLVPHFEKMLYDNAQLACLYLDAFLLSGKPEFAHVARDTIEYVLRDLAHPDGGFYCAEDADSEGKEGKFYCWTLAELTAGLTPPELAVAIRHYGITEHGNFVDHSDPAPLAGQNVLSIVDPNLTADDRARLESANRKLFAIRAARVRPHRDDKILSSWNGLMLGALARAHAVLGEQRYRVAAERNLAFIQTRLWDSEKRVLYHRWRDGEHDTVQLLDAYALLLAGLIDLYEVTLDPATLEFALALATGMIDRFHDARNGGFWQSPAGAPDLIQRLKDDYDGAIPSGNSAAIHGLLRIAAIADRPDFAEAAESGLRRSASRLRQFPQVVTHLLGALDFRLDAPRRVVIAGDPDHPDFDLLICAAHRVYQPNKVVLGVRGPVEAVAQGLPPSDGLPVASVCAGTTCQPPTRDPDRLRQSLSFD